MLRSAPARHCARSTSFASSHRLHQPSSAPSSAAERRYQAPSRHSAPCEMCLASVKATIPCAGLLSNFAAHASFCDSLSYVVEISQHVHEGTHVDLRILAVALPGHVRREY